MTSRYKCPNCAGAYEYDAKSGGLKCSKCGSVVKIAESGEIIAHSYGENAEKYNSEWAKSVRQVKCRECGAQVVLNNFDIISKCSYCGSSNMVDINQASIAPDAVIPFEIDKLEAKNHFKEGIKKKHFVPNMLKKQLPDLEAQPNYIGSYIFDGSVFASYNGEVEYEEDVNNHDGTSKNITRTKHVSGVIDHKFDNFIVECSDNLTQAELTQILPFNLSKKKSYNGEYLLGASADYANKSLEQANRELEYALKRDVEQEIKRKYHADGIRNMHISFDYKAKNYIYCLMPTYLFCYDYKKKNYKTIMNGQTGKLGGGVPRSPVKITFFVLFLLAIFAGFISLFFI